MQIGLWDIASGATINHWSYLDSASIAMFTPDGKYVAVVNGSVIELWLPEGKTPFRKLTSPKKSLITNLAVSPNGQFILTGRQNGIVDLVDSSTGQELCTFTGHHGAITDVSFLPDGHIALTAGTDGTARLWDVNSGLELRRLSGHRGSIFIARYAPDGTQVATVSLAPVMHLPSLKLKERKKT